jgi:phosphoglycolate phosphatase
VLTKETKHILWDWNGTLLDDAWITYQTVLHLIEHYQQPSLTFEDYRRHFRIPIELFYQRIGFDLPAVGIEKVAQHFHQHYEQQRPSFRLHTGVSDALQLVRKIGLQQSIFSAHPQDQLSSAVEHLGITSHFDKILGASSNKGVSKIAHGSQWLKRSGFLPHQVTLVGDTDHDAEVAKELGFRCVLVAGGHQARDVLEATGFPVHADLQELISSL